MAARDVVLDDREPTNPHDALFNACFAEAENARGLLETVLPTELQQHLRLSELTVDERSFLGDELDWRHADALYRIPAAWGDAFA